MKKQVGNQKMLVAITIGALLALALLGSCVIHECATSDASKLPIISGDC
jgi:hypothetical protein